MTEKTHCRRGHELTPDNIRTNHHGNRQCKTCQTAKHKEWAASHHEQNTEFKNAWLRKNPEKRRRAQSKWRIENLDLQRTLIRRWKIKTFFGLTAEEYDSRKNGQGNRCAICLRTPEEAGKKKSLVLDHDHATEGIRGFLCGSCNLAIGLFQDDVVRLRAAASYIEKHKEITQLEKMVEA